MVEVAFERVVVQQLVVALELVVFERLVVAALALFVVFVERLGELVRWSVVAGRSLRTEPVLDLARDVRRARARRGLRGGEAA